MIQLPSASHSHCVSIVQDFKKNDSRAQELLMKKFGRVLRILIRYRCADHMEDCLAAAIEETIAAIAGGDVLEDSELPALVHRAFKRVSARYPKHIQVTTGGSATVSKGAVDQLRKHLEILTPVQREALYRYVTGHKPALICQDLELEPLYFQFIKRHVMFAARFSVTMLKSPMRTSTAVEKVATFENAAVS